MMLKPIGARVPALLSAAPTPDTEVPKISQKRPLEPSDFPPGFELLEDHPPPKLRQGTLLVPCSSIWGTAPAQAKTRAMMMPAPPVGPPPLHLTVAATGAAPTAAQGKKPAPPSEPPPLHLVQHQQQDEARKGKGKGRGKGKGKDKRKSKGKGKGKGKRKGDEEVAPAGGEGEDDEEMAPAGGEEMAPAGGEGEGAVGEEVDEGFLESLSATCLLLQRHLQTLGFGAGALPLT